MVSCEDLAMRTGGAKRRQPGNVNRVFMVIFRSGPLSESLLVVAIRLTMLVGVVLRRRVVAQANHAEMEMRVLFVSSVFMGATAVLQMAKAHSLEEEC